MDDSQSCFELNNYKKLCTRSLFYIVKILEKHTQPSDYQMLVFVF